MAYINQIYYFSTKWIIKFPTDNLVNSSLLSLPPCCNLSGGVILLEEPPLPRPSLPAVFTDDDDGPPPSAAAAAMPEAAKRFRRFVTSRKMRIPSSFKFLREYFFIWKQYLLAKYLCSKKTKKNNLFIL